MFSRLRPLDPFAPGAIHFCDDVDVLGAPFQLPEYRAGQPIGGALPDELRGKFRPQRASCRVELTTRTKCLATYG